jgi:GDP-L-fucose synthase
MMLKKNSKIFLAGHNGMVGSAIKRYFEKKKYKNIITINKSKLNFINQAQTLGFLKKIKPQFVIIAAAKVGGILANNSKKAEFIYENLMIQTNLIHASYQAGVRNLIFLGSSCIYPKLAIQPIKEDYLLSGKLEPTNDSYAIAKIAGIKMCQSYNDQYGLNYLCLMPTNLYGPNDNYNIKTSHFFPALISKIHDAKIKKKKIITIWGDGKPKRELMYVEDLAMACEFFLKKRVKHTLINIGSGEEKTIKEFCNFLMKKIKINLTIKYDLNKPKGTPRKKLDTTLAKRYGWKSKFSLEKGFEYTYQDYLKNYNL